MMNRRSPGHWCVFGILAPSTSLGASPAWGRRAIAGFLGVAVALLTGCASSPDSASAASKSEESGSLAVTNTGSYMRVGRPDTNTLTLQIALKRFVPGKKSKPGPDIWLAAVSHIGETNYFESLQEFLDARDLVLFEGVGFEEARRMKAAYGDSAVDDGGGNLQSTLALSLGLAFQLEAIDYERDHFKNSDMSIAQIQDLMVRQVEEGGLGDTARTNPEFLALMAAMEGSSWFGAVLHMGVRLLGTSPKLQAMTRLMLIEILGGVQGDMSQMQGMPPDIQELLRVLIQSRNEVVVEDVKRSLQQSRSKSSIAIFYGAAHMEDMERRIASELGYRPGGETWLDAITVRPRMAGLSDFEIATVRGLVQWQLEALGDAASKPGHE